MLGKTGRILACAGVVAGSAFLGLEVVGHGSGPPRELTILATGDVHARVRRCGCQGDKKPAANETIKPVSGCGCNSRAVLDGAQALLDFGAFPERSAFQAAYGADALVVDTGDLFFPSLSPKDYERAEWKLRAQLVTDLEERLALAAFVPGELDFALGRKVLEELAQRAKFAFLCANLRDAKTHQPLFASRAVFVRKDIRVGVTAVLQPGRPADFDALLAGESLELSDAAAAVRAEVEALRKDGCEVIVLLAHAPDMLARRIGRNVPGIDVVVEAHGDVPTDSVSLIEGSTAYVAPHAGGGVPLRVRMTLVPGGSGVLDEPGLIETRSWATRIRGQLEGQIRERERATGGRARDLDVQIDFASKKLAEYEAKLPKEPRHLVTAQGIVLAAAQWKQGQDKAILDAIERFKTDVRALALDPAIVERLEAPGKTPSGQPLAFATEKACASCHVRQEQVWSRSKHAGAWASLEKTGSDKDPECVRCHSIGFREPGGFAEVGRSQRDGLEFRNVQCESCHGPRLGHPQTPALGVHFPTADACRGCHDREHDPAFDEKKFRTALTGQVVCTKGLPQ